MKYNPFIRLLCSIPIILVFLYFIPFVGVCLILLRYFLYSEKKKILVPIILMLVGSLILIPGCLLELAKMTNFNIPSKITSIFTDSFYSVNLINYSKNLFIVGIIFLFLIFSGCELYHSSKKYFSTIFINTSLSSILLISHLNSLEFCIFLVYQAIRFLISLIAVTSGLFSNSS